MDIYVCIDNERVVNKEEKVTCKHGSRFVEVNKGTGKHLWGRMKHNRNHKDGKKKNTSNFEYFLKKKR